MEPITKVDGKPISDLRSYYLPVFFFAPRTIIGEELALQVHN